MNDKNDKNGYIEAAQQIIASLGLPRAQQNERSALSHGKMPDVVLHYTKKNWLL